MLIPKNNRKKIYQYLFQEGVMVAKKDFNAAKHQDVDVPNLQVIKALQSMTSRGYVATRFSWQYYYYYLTNEGIEYLREYLHLPVEIVPRTFIKTTKSVSRPGRPDGERAPRGDGDRFNRPRGDGEYRRRDDRPSAAGEKKEGAAGDWRPEFRGGVGRGGPRPAQQ
ncbi:putative 40S ribosomal protein S10-B [Powellomyces hirtus]|nr:putative 40S ribosomal protein S10-B [Powellomyces hirtus]